MMWTLVMGVDLGGLFQSENCAFSDFKDRVIAIDAYNVLYQFISTIRSRDGTPLKNSRGDVTSHLSGLLQRTANLVEERIRPVYVFDGEPHPLKAKTLEERRKRKEHAEQLYQEALEKGDEEAARKYAQQTSRITDDIIQQSKELLDALHIPWIQAPSEGEAQASYMVRKGDAYAVGSQDFDCLLFGASLLIRNLTSSEKRKLPNKKSYVKIHPKLIRLKPNLKKLEINQKQLIDVALLMGTDFNDGVKGIGPKKGLKALQQNGNIENAIETMDLDDAPTENEIKTIRNLFLKPAVTDDYSLQWSPPDKEAVLHLLVDHHQFSEERINPILDKYQNLETLVKQKNLFEF